MVIALVQIRPQLAEKVACSVSRGVLQGEFLGINGRDANRETDLSWFQAVKLETGLREGAGN
jgi:hypothetical protein